MTRLKPGALAALKAQEQADFDGTMVKVSREALDNAIAVLETRDEAFDEDLDEALQDAVADGEGRATPYYLKTHLAARGLVIEPMGAPSDIAVSIEREACAAIADAIDSGRGNEKQIAKSIRARGDHAAATRKDAQR